MWREPPHFNFRSYPKSPSQDFYRAIVPLWLIKTIEHRNRAFFTFLIQSAFNSSWLKIMIFVNCLVFIRTLVFILIAFSFVHIYRSTEDTSVRRNWTNQQVITSTFQVIQKQIWFAWLLNKLSQWKIRKF